jgi:glyoxylase-like metal-dependent hydrolase (beta-lactamase superfamily II)
MAFYHIYGISYDSNIYVITGENPTIIDCGTGLHSNYVEDKIKEIVDPLKIKQIILTHEHYDHCGGVKKIHSITNDKARILAHIKAADKIENGDSDFARMLGGVMPKMPVDIKLKEGDVLKIGNETFDVLNTPGHTPGCICLYGKKSKTLFSGDTIFSYGSFGRYDFPGGDGKQLRKSIERISKLDVVNLYPGHESIVEGEGNKHIMATLENSKYLNDL